MPRRKKWPEKVNLTCLDVGREQFLDVERARSLILVESPSGTRPMDRSELCREALHDLVGRLKSGRYRAPKEPRAGEARIVEVGEWMEDQRREDQ